ncbi:MAG: CBS domain-containing protein [bacterium]|nr:CBS domain-containing protein [bacterium]
MIVSGREPPDPAMGERNIHHKPGRSQLRTFTKALLDDVQALERMLADNVFESGVRRIGAEQEMFLVDRSMGPAMTAVEVLETLDDARFTSELGKFNIEANLTPRILKGDGLSELEREIETLLAKARKAADVHDSRILLAGILPTIKKGDLSLDSIMPEPRYHELNRAMCEHRDGEFRLGIKGLDELRITHDNLMCEACNSSFQVHFQVGADEFVHLYNLAQAVTAPVLAAATYSPFFLQHRLWHETRLAVFQQGVDVRSDGLQARQARPRVAFGDSWVETTVSEIYKEDIARFRVLLSSDLGDPSTEILDRGEIPLLRALSLHNGTVYRWNRPCYGVVDGTPNLRIEHRILPSGPTVVDEVANAAFFFGLMVALSDEYKDVTKVMNFDDVKTNVIAAARYGLKAQFVWVGGKSFTAQQLVLDHLLPPAREGLHDRGIDSADIDRYLGVIEERVRTARTGSQWALDSLADMGDHGTRDERFRAIATAMYERHIEGKPVHEWSLATQDESTDWRDSYRFVEQVMTTDLFTVGPEDLVDLAANLMDWERIRHVPVEDNSGKLVGIISHRQLLRLVGRGQKGDAPVAAREIMTPDPITVTPQTESLKAMAIMRKHKVSCLPVVEDDNKLVGIVSEQDFIAVAAMLLEDQLRDVHWHDDE